MGVEKGEAVREEAVRTHGLGGEGTKGVGQLDEFGLQLGVLGGEGGVLRLKDLHSTLEDGEEIPLFLTGSLGVFSVLDGATLVLQKHFLFLTEILGGLEFLAVSVKLSTGHVQQLLAVEAHTRQHRVLLLFGCEVVSTCPWGWCQSGLSSLGDRGLWAV